LCFVNTHSNTMFFSRKKLEIRGHIRAVLPPPAIGFNMIIHLLEGIMTGFEMRV